MPKDFILHVRLTDEEKIIIMGEAKKKGFSVSQYVRWILRGEIINSQNTQALRDRDRGA